jgi:hypothetical protein
LAWFYKATKTHAKIYPFPRTYTKDKQGQFAEQDLAYLLYRLHLRTYFFIYAISAQVNKSGKEKIAC